MPALLEHANGMALGSTNCPTGVVLGTCPHEHSDIAILGSDPFGAQTRTNTLGCHTWGGIERAVGGMGWYRAARHGMPRG
jgi:hypothetical protein